MNEKHQFDLERVPKELKLILELLKEKDFDNQELPTTIDWDLFLNLAMHHRVYPVLYKKLNGIYEDLEIPTFVMETLQAQYKRNTFQMLYYSAEMQQISTLFNNHQIRLLFLKGPALGHKLYGDISLRTSGDLDVLIPINQLKEADKLLLEQGYKKDDYIKTVLNDWKWRHHHVTYIHPKKGIKVEVHWKLHPTIGREPNFNELWSQRKQVSLTSSEVYTLKEEYLFLFLVEHGARHGWSRLRWLLDIHQLMNKRMDWAYVVMLLKKYDSLHIGGQGIILASQLFNTEIPTEQRPLFIKHKSKKLANQAIFYLESMIHLHADSVPIEVSRYHKRYLFSLMSRKQKLLFILSFLYPYPEDAETLRLPKSLHLLYFPLRPFLWAWRKTRSYV